MSTELAINGVIEGAFDFRFCVAAPGGGEQIRLTFQNRIRRHAADVHEGEINRVMLCTPLETRLTTIHATPDRPGQQLRLLLDDPMRPLLASIRNLSNAGVRAQIRDLLPEISRALSSAWIAGLPSLKLTEHEDGSASIEWRFPDRRLAFSFETDPEESGWHFVSSHASGGVLASGQFSGNFDLPVLLAFRR